MNEQTKTMIQGPIVKIGGTIYEIENTPYSFDDDKTTVMGDIDQVAAKIKINNLDPSIAQVRKQQSLIHEILHAMIFEAGCENEIDEKLIKRLAMVMYQVVKENDLVDLLDQIAND